MYRNLKLLMTGSLSKIVGNHLTQKYIIVARTNKKLNFRRRVLYI